MRGGVDLGSVGGVWLEEGWEERVELREGGGTGVCEGRGSEPFAGSRRYGLAGCLAGE